MRVYPIGEPDDPHAKGLGTLVAAKVVSVMLISAIGFGLLFMWLGPAAFLIAFPLAVFLVWKKWPKEMRPQILEDRITKKDLKRLTDQVEEYAHLEADWNRWYE